MFTEIIQFPYRFLRIFLFIYAQYSFNYNAVEAFVCLPFCARYLCIMKGEVGGERRKEHNYCSCGNLWHSRPICGFCFWWTQKSSFVSLIDFCNNSSHFAYERMEELMNYIMLCYFLHRSLRWDYGQEKWLQRWKKQTIRSEPANGKSPSERD